MLRFYYNKEYKYTNRKIIDISNDNNFLNKDYVNIDSPDTINGHIIYELEAGEVVPTYIYDTETTWRWFISGITQLRTGKFQLSLLRDIISENPDVWSNEQAYISAGLANDYNRYKRWDLPFTNTKVKQERLNFGGKSSFFVYYVNEQKIASNALTEDDLQITGVTIPGIGSANYDYSVASLSDIPYFNYVNAGDVNYWSSPQCYLRFFIKSGSSIYSPQDRYRYEYWNNNIYNNGGGFIEGTPNDSMTIFTTVQDIDNNSSNCKTKLRDAVKTFLTNYQSSLGTSITNTEVNSLLDYAGKYIYCTGDSKIYTIKYTKEYFSYNDNLDKNTTYYIQVLAVDLANNCSTSGELQIKTKE